jgi:uncharacterized membrane protein
MNHAIVLAIGAGIGLLLIATGIPLLLRRVRPNGIYGVRLPATLADETVWYEINARGGRDLILIGVLYLMLLTLCFTVVTGWSMEARLLVPIALLVIALLIEAVRLAIAANVMLAARRR